MIILGIETSCDETAAAILEHKDGSIQILSNIIASSASIQTKYGGVIPEQAAREQLKSIIPVIKEALSAAFPNYQLLTTNYPPIDAIAITYGPGLIGSLLVGVETAKTLAVLWNKPLIPVNHLLGHFYANWIGKSVVSSKQQVVRKKKQNTLYTNYQLLTTNYPPSFPCIGLLVSGGHTDLVLFQDHGKYQYLGGTRDDAAGECFDKCARLLGLPYPGGPQIGKLAKQGDPTKYKFPRPMINSDDFDLSFSGLKTAVANLIHRSTNIPTSKLADLSASIEQAIIDVLVKKAVKAAKYYKVDHLLLAGGVAANQNLADYLDLTMKKNFGAHVRLFVPPPSLCTDNGAMIAASAFYTGKKINPLKLQANPNLSLAY